MTQQVSPPCFLLPVPSQIADVKKRPAPSLITQASICPLAALSASSLSCSLASPPSLPVGLRVADQLPRLEAAVLSWSCPAPSFLT